MVKRERCFLWMMLMFYPADPLLCDRYRVCKFVKVWGGKYCACEHTSLSPPINILDKWGYSRKISFFLLSTLEAVQIYKYPWQVGILRGNIIFSFFQFWRLLMLLFQSYNRNSLVLPFIKALLTNGPPLNLIYFCTSRLKLIKRFQIEMDAFWLQCELTEKLKITKLGGIFYVETRLLVFITFLAV